MQDRKADSDSLCNIQPRQYIGVDVDAEVAHNETGSTWSCPLG